MFRHTCIPCRFVHSDQMNSQNCIEEKQRAHHTCAYMLTDMDTDWKFWFSRYFVKSTFVLGSCTYTQYIMKALKCKPSANCTCAVPLIGLLVCVYCVVSHHYCNPCCACVPRVNHVTKTEWYLDHRHERQANAELESSVLSNMRY